MDKILALWRKHLEEEIDNDGGDTRLANIRYSEGVSFLCDVRVPRASLYGRKPRRAKRVVDSPSSPIVRRTLQLKDATYEWVDYSAPLVCLEEEEDGVCLREEPTPCSDDPNSLVCSIDTRQLPQKRKRNPWVSVCIDDMGVDYYMSRRAVRLRPAVTLSYLPYGLEVREQARAASAAGHELMVHLPMEPFNKAADAGPNALHSSMTQEQLRQHLHWALSQFDGYVGLNNHMGSLFTSRFHDGMRVVLEELRRRDLFFLDSLTATDSLGQELAAHLGTTFGARDVFLDSQRDDVGAVEERLAEVEQLALKNGHAIAIGHPYEATLEALERWLPLLQAKGLRLMPLKKALLRERKERERMAGEAMLTFTRSKQLRDVQAARERAERDQHARALAAQLEAEFGDGTVLGWRGLLDAGAADALRLALEKRRQAPNGLRASLARLLLLTPFHGGGRGARGPHVEKAALRLLRKRGTAGRLADMVAPQARGQAAQAVGRSKVMGARKLAAQSRRRGVEWWSKGERGGLGALLGDAERQALEEEGRRPVCGWKVAESSKRAELAVLAKEGPLPSSPSSKRNRSVRRTKVRAGQKVHSSQRPEVVAATECAAQVGWVGKQRGDGTDNAEILSLSVNDKAPSVLVSAPHLETGALQWQPGAGRTLAMRRWLAGSKGGEMGAESDSPRTVLATEQFEAAADASSQGESFVGSGALSLTSDSCDFAAVAEASERAWSPERSSSSSSRRSLGSVSEGSSQEEEGRQAVEQGGSIACRVIAAAAMGMAVALQLSLLASRGGPEVTPEAKTTATAATTVAAAGDGSDGHLPSVTSGSAAGLMEAAGCLEEVVIATTEEVETAPAALTASPIAIPPTESLPKESQQESAVKTMVEVPEEGAGSQQEAVSSFDALDRIVPAVSAEAAASDSGVHMAEEESAPVFWATREGEASEQLASRLGSLAPPSCSDLAFVQGRDEVDSEASLGTSLVRSSVGHRPLKPKSQDAPAGLLALVHPDRMEHTRRPLVPQQHAGSSVKAQELGDGASMDGTLTARESLQEQQGATDGEHNAVAGDVAAEAEGGVREAVGEQEEAAEAEGDVAPRASSLPWAIPSSLTPRMPIDDGLQWWDAAASPLSTACSSPASWGDPQIASRKPAPQHSGAGGNRVSEAGVDGTRGRVSQAGPVAAAERAPAEMLKGEASKKKYGWWRWTVGCVLGDMDEAVREKEGAGKGRAGGGRGSRRVVPINVSDEETG